MYSRRPAIVVVPIVLLSYYPIVGPASWGAVMKGNRMPLSHTLSDPHNTLSAQFRQHSTLEPLLKLESKNHELTQANC